MDVKLAATRCHSPSNLHSRSQSVKESNIQQLNASVKPTDNDFRVDALAAPSSARAQLRCKYTSN